MRGPWKKIAIAAGSLATILLVLPLSIGVLSATVAVLVGTAATAGVSLLLAKRYTSLSVSLSRDSLTGLLVPSLPLGATLLFNLVYFRADMFLITLTRPTTEVGIYGLAYKVFEVALVTPTFFMNAIYPLLLSAKTENSKFKIQNSKFMNMIIKSGTFLLFTSFILLLVMWLAAPLLTLVRQDFTSSIAALRVLSLGLPLFFLTSLTMWTLIALKKQWLLAAIYAFSMVINISANIWLIPVYGYMAAAWITVGSEAIVLLISTSVLWPLVHKINMEKH